MEKLESEPDYFCEAQEICEEQGLVPLMTFTHDYSKEVIFQFYATVVFLEDENEVHSLKWMTKEHICYGGHMGRVCSGHWLSTPQQ
jgi:hypothetical protein